MIKFYNISLQQLPLTLMSTLAFFNPHFTNLEENITLSSAGLILYNFIFVFLKLRVNRQGKEVENNIQKPLKGDLLSLAFPKSHAVCATSLHICESSHIFLGITTHSFPIFCNDLIPSPPALQNYRQESSWSCPTELQKIRIWFERNNFTCALQ